MTDKITIDRSVVEQPDIVNPISVPQGWKLVPVEPTNEMVQAWLDTYEGNIQTVYRAMLAAAPQPPTIKQSLAVKQSQGDPVGWLPLDGRGGYTHPQPPRQPLTDSVKDAFFEGFTSVETYNDTRLNSVEEAWAEYKAAHGITGEHGIKEQK